MRTKSIVLIATLSALLVLGLIILKSNSNTYETQQLGAQTTSPKSSTKPSTSEPTGIDLCELVKKIFGVNSSEYKDCVSVHLPSHPKEIIVNKKVLGECSSKNACPSGYGACGADYQCLNAYTNGLCWMRLNVNNRYQSTDDCFEYFAPCDQKNVQCGYANKCTPKSAVIDLYVSSNSRISKDDAVRKLIDAGQAACEATKAASYVPPCDAKNACVDTIKGGEFSYSFISGYENCAYNNGNRQFECNTTGACTMVRSCKHR